MLYTCADLTWLRGFVRLAFVTARAVPDHEFTGYQPDSEFKIQPDPDTGYRIPDSNI